MSFAKLYPFILILFFLQLYLCQQQYLKLLNDDNINNTSSFNETFTIGGALTEASLGSNRLIPKTISEYPSPANVRTKYTTDEEDYTLSESISFSLLTNQQISQATTILSGFAYDNIYYVFDIEDGKPKIIFSQDDLPEVILTSKSTNQMMINDGKWHRLNVQRLDRKLRFDLDNVEQSDVQLPDGWQTKTNIFIGAELTPVPNGNFNGKIGD
ncbi:unnamed protein product, partial [Rotaria magnacalcarata]